MVSPADGEADGMSGDGCVCAAVSDVMMNEYRLTHTHMIMSLSGCYDHALVMIADDALERD